MDIDAPDADARALADFYRSHGRWPSGADQDPEIARIARVLYGARVAQVRGRHGARNLARIAYWESLGLPWQKRERPRSTRVMGDAIALEVIEYIRAHGKAPTTTPGRGREERLGRAVAQARAAEDAGVIPDLVRRRITLWDGADVDWRAPEDTAAVECASFLAEYGHWPRTQRRGTATDEARLFAVLNNARNIIRRGQEPGPVVAARIAYWEAAGLPWQDQTYRLGVEAVALQLADYFHKHGYMPETDSPQPAVAKLASVVQRIRVEDERGTLTLINAERVAYWDAKGIPWRRPTDPIGPAAGDYFDAHGHWPAPQHRDPELRRLAWAVLTARQADKGARRGDGVVAERIAHWEARGLPWRDGDMRTPADERATRGRKRAQPTPAHNRAELWARFHTRLTPVGQRALEATIAEQIGKDADMDQVAAITDAVLDLLEITID